MIDVDATAGKVTIHTFDTVDEAQRAANQEASATGGQQLPAILFQQGRRKMLTTAFLIPIISNRLQASHAAKRGSVEEVRAATNRPVMEDHVESVKSYIKSNVGQSYILPPLTLNARQRLSVYKANYESTVMAVTLVIPSNVKLEITDGSHRKRAIDEALSELPEELADELRCDAVAVMITIEDDLSQIHQDFADASKTKALPKSQLAAYDRRNPANGIVLDMVQDCALFRGRVDSTSKTLSKNSNKLFLTNQVRQMVKELLVGSYAMGDDPFEVRAVQILGSSDSAQYRIERARFVEFVDAITDAFPILRRIADMPEAGVAGERIRDARQEGWICLQATGLVVIGRIGHLLFKHDVVDWKDYVARMGELDWRKSGSLWQGNIIQQDGKLMTQQTPVKGAVAAVRDAIDLSDGKLGLPEQPELLDEAA